MAANFDIFQIASNGLMWRAAAEDLNSAREKVKDMLAAQPGEYFLFEQKTGIRYPVKSGESGGIS